ncbi:MAG: deoxyribose-phosphate aldolase [Flavobacteriaceae bacterium]|nr:deoxyribose-phosphate aldolase [Flavobacteriaceae bacterium]
MKLNHFIDHTLLKPAATPEDIIKLCKEAIEYEFCSVCVNSSYVKVAKKELDNSDVKVCAVVGFPLGAMSSKAKAYEAQTAIDDGADEIDMVMNIGLLKSNNESEVIDDIKAVKTACGDRVLKVILEISELTEDEIRKACLLCVEGGADFVKTSTGFSSGGATIEAVKIMKNTVGPNAKIKASGGIRDYETAMEFINLGIHRLGVSAGIAIVQGGQNDQGY